MSDNMIFCLGDGSHKQEGYGFQKYNRAFNEQVTEERFLEIVKLIKNDILKDFKPKLNKEDWSDEWKKVTKEQWKRIAEIPEFDKWIVEAIIGFELDLEEVEEMTVEQISKELGREIKIVK